MNESVVGENSQQGPRLSFCSWAVAQISGESFWKHRVI